MAILRRVIDFVPDIGGLIPIPYNFDILAGGEVIGHVNRKFNLRDQYVLDLSGDPGAQARPAARRSCSRSGSTRCRTARRRPGGDGAWPGLAALRQWSMGSTYSPRPFRHSLRGTYGEDLVLTRRAAAHIQHGLCTRSSSGQPGPAIDLADHSPFVLPDPLEHDVAAVLR